ncbi:MAG TPA: cyclopropane-fatty-acyl-phospholipid synthase family protein [Steroidobacteraceae bacterium]|nr:cyclopropane-fatty-acyl-phospholipid synthase family protein [Steroidobacteraceae bacterium]
MKPTIVPAAGSSEAAPIDRASTRGAAAGLAARPDSTGGLAARLGRAGLLRALSRLQHGEIRLIDAAEEQRFGHLSQRCALSVTIRVLDARFYAKAAFGGSVGAGEAYIQGYWSCDDLTALVRIMVVNRGALKHMERGIARLSRPVRRAAHWLRRNSPAGSARNIAAHYDIGNELYSLMLDETMAYSCGIFQSEQATLAQASRAKFDAACSKLALAPGDHLLEIGTGWGGLAIHAARHYGCRVTTTTISRAQHDYARERIEAAGLGERITLLLTDYRELSGCYDKLVSIEMVEAVGAQYLPAFFARCSQLLAPHGAMLLQAITLQDQLYAEAIASVDYIQRFIFPGSFIPSVSALLEAVRDATDLKLFHLEDIGPHYARTLALWRRNFFEHLDEVHRLGYPQSFVRLWEFYLCYCEGGFAERQLGDVQMLLTKPACRRAPLATVNAPPTLSPPG